MRDLKGFTRRPTGGIGAMDGPDRVKPRAEANKQDVYERKPNPSLSGIIF